MRNAGVSHGRSSCYQRSARSKVCATAGRGHLPLACVDSEPDKSQAWCSREALWGSGEGEAAQQAGALDLTLHGCSYIPGPCLAWAQCGAGPSALAHGGQHLRKMRSLVSSFHFLTPRGRQFHQEAGLSLHRQIILAHMPREGKRVAKNHTGARAGLEAQGGRSGENPSL